MQHNKRFEQTPDANIYNHGNPVFCVFVWPLRARPSLGTAQLKRSVIQPDVQGFSPSMTFRVHGDAVSRWYPVALALTQR